MADRGLALIPNTPRQSILMRGLKRRAGQITGKPFFRPGLIVGHPPPDVPAPAMAAHDSDPVERRHVALRAALSSRLPPAILAFA